MCADANLAQKRRIAAGCSSKKSAVPARCILLPIACGKKVLKSLGDQTAATPPSAIQKRSIIRRAEFTRPLEILSSIAAAGAVLAGLRILSTLTEKKADADAFINMAVAMRNVNLPTVFRE
jgi:hypothetical protein